MSALSAEEIAQSLKDHAGWSADHGALTRRFEFPDFVAAMRFVNAVAEAAESAGHHPDIDIRYNKVMLALWSHDAGGITARVFQLASAIDRIT
jgi:4a-hydroxytetrahydrobiopterin dehydratase